jgi:hypothetical protein
MRRQASCCSRFECARYGSIRKLIDVRGEPCDGISELSGKDSQLLEIYASSFSVVTLFAVTGASTYDAVFRLCCDAVDEPVDAQMVF